MERITKGLQHAGSAVVVGLLLVGGFAGGHLLAPGHSDEEEAEQRVEPAANQTVTLPADKRQAAGIRVQPVQRQAIRKTKTVAAQIDYQLNRHLTIKSAVPCVVREWRVRVGQQVDAGHVLAVLSATEVALARSEIKKARADVRLAQINHEWQTETYANLTALLATLKTHPTSAELSARFDSKRLGEHRDHLLKAYAEYALASRVLDRTRALGNQGIVAGKTAEERANQRDITATQFQTACEQSEFEGRRALEKSKAELTLAEQSLAVARQRLTLLTGTEAKDGDESSSSESSGDRPDGDFEVRASFAGRVDALHAAPTARLDRGEPLVSISDTRSLIVSALVHQHDWDALAVTSGGTVSVTVPAVPKQTFQARVRYVGPQVSQETRAVSLVAELDNPEGRFRPGLFAWVGLPMEPLREALIVPAGAVQRHDGAHFVFVEVGEGTYRRVPVTVGLETSEFVEIKRGLSAGQPVVDRGAFYLKSELLLEQDGE